MYLYLQYDPNKKFWRRFFLKVKILNIYKLKAFIMWINLKIIDLFNLLNYFND